MKILNKKILNKAATFLLAVVVLCCNVMQVRADNQTDINFGNFSEESNAKFINKTGYHYFFEDILRFNVYPQHQDATYRGGFTVFPEIEVSFYNHDNVDSLITINTSIDYIEVFYTDGTSNMVNFAVDEKKFTTTVSALSKSSFSFSFPVDILLDGYFYSPGTVNVQIHLKHQLDFLGDYGFELTNCIIGAELEKSWLEYEFGKYDNPNEVIIIEQNNTLINKLTSWFESLFQRMDDKQNELINGYQDTTTSEAASAFSSESDKLTALEEVLSTQSNTYVSDYAAAGFDLGVLGTLGSSLIFVTTWFTNFWNMGGVFTAALNFCFALSIVFFILRIKR